MHSSVSRRRRAAAASADLRRGGAQRRSGGRWYAWLVALLGLGYVAALVGFRALHGRAAAAPPSSYFVLPPPEPWSPAADVVAAAREAPTPAAAAAAATAAPTAAAGDEATVSAALAELGVAAPAAAATTAHGRQNNRDTIFVAGLPMSGSDAVAELVAAGRGAAAATAATWSEAEGRALRREAVVRVPGAPPVGEKVFEGLAAATARAGGRATFVVVALRLGRRGSARLRGSRPGSAKGAAFVKSWVWGRGARLRGLGPSRRAPGGAVRVVGHAGASRATTANACLPPGSANQALGRLAVFGRGWELRGRISSPASVGTL